MIVAESLKRGTTTAITPISSWGSSVAQNQVANRHPRPMDSSSHLVRMDLQICHSLPTGWVFERLLYFVICLNVGGTKACEN